MKPEDLMHGNGMVIQYGRKFKVWTDYGEFDLPDGFGEMERPEQFKAITLVVIDGMNRYWGRPKKPLDEKTRQILESGWASGWVVREDC